MKVIVAILAKFIIHLTKLILLLHPDKPYRSSRKKHLSLPLYLLTHFFLNVTSDSAVGFLNGEKELENEMRAIYLQLFKHWELKCNLAFYEKGNKRI